MLKTFTFWIPEEQKKELRRLAYEEERPISDMLREAIADYLKKQTAEAFRPSPPPPAE